jgi:hypothetical protein
MNPPALGVALPSLLRPNPLICECAAVLLSRALLFTSLTGTVAIVYVLYVSRLTAVKRRLGGDSKTFRSMDW